MTRARDCVIRDALPRSPAHGEPALAHASRREAAHPPKLIAAWTIPWKGSKLPRPFAADRLEAAVTASLSLLVIRCSSLNASKRFYETLGLTFTLEKHEVGPHHWCCQLGPTLLELYPRGNDLPSPIRLGLRVPDVRAAVTAAVAEGGRLIGIVDPARTVVLDPDGNRIELTPQSAASSPRASRPDHDPTGDDPPEDRSFETLLARGLEFLLNQEIQELRERLSPETLATISDRDLERAVLEFVERYSERCDGDLLLALEKLPSGFRTIHTTWLLEAEVRNGGFNQYFWNSSRAFALDALASLHDLGKPELADLLARAIELWQKDQARLAPLRECESLEAFSESYVDNPLNDLDHEFDRLASDLRHARARFIRHHPELFLAELVAGA